MKKAFFFLSMLLLVACTTNKEESKYCTYKYTYQFDEKEGWYGNEPIKTDSIINETPIDVIINDGIVMKPQEHPEYNVMSAMMPNGKTRNAKRASGGFKAFSECKQAQKVSMYNQNIEPVFSDDINFEKTNESEQKEDGSFYKYMMIVQEMLVLDRGLFSDITQEKEEPIRLLNDEGNDFYIFGIPATSGKDAVLMELEQLGFAIDGEITECDLTFGVGDITYYANYVSDCLDEFQVNRLTGGLFDGLNHPALEIGTMHCRVFLQWYKSGIIKEAVIELGSGVDLPDEDALEVNKRLLALFGNSKIGNKRMGLMTYYNDHIESYYPNGLMLRFERR